MVVQEQISSHETVSIENCTQLAIDDSHVPKIRKPYTISKQRERWSDDEHDKFLEALKLHSRAWKKIEEHIGTKTAVQIRSHAQKFFSKVVRETSNSNTSSTEPIEIPPPRPKRKPSHPYPRKHMLPTQKDNSVEKLARSVSPTSVLSLDEFVEAKQTDFLPSDDTAFPDEVHASPSPSPSPSPSSTDDLASETLERFPSINSYEKPEPVSTKVFKLFGKDLIVPISDLSPSSDMGETVFQASPENVQSAKNSWNCETLYCVDGSGNQVEKPVPLPWWVFFKGTSVSPFECHGVENALEKDSSCADSSSEAGLAENDNCNADSQAECKPSKGFVPYKRCFSDRDGQSSSDNKRQKPRLCL